MGISYESVRKHTAKFGKGGHATAFAFKGYGFVVFMRHRASLSRKNARAQWYVINRYYVHTIGEGAKQGLRFKGLEKWTAYMRRIFELAWSKFHGKTAAIGKHKGSPPWETGGAAQARPPPKANRRGLRRLYPIAADVQLRYENFSSRPGIELQPWALNRAYEGHTADRMVECLGHAVRVLAQKSPWVPAKPQAWVCEVARRHLEADGLAPIQRKRAERERLRRSAPAFKDGVFEDENDDPGLPWEEYVDSQGGVWEHQDGQNLRRKKRG